jgi:HEAT repeat protein
VLRAAVNSSDVSVRSAVAGALAQAGDDASVDALLQLTRDSDPGVKQQALAALGQTGSARAVDALVSASSSGDAGQRMAAVSSLGAVDDPRASQALSRLIEDGDEQVAAAAIWAAYNGGDDVDRALLRVFGGTSSDSVRVAAAQQIRARGIEVDDATTKRLDDLLGASGGYGYGGYGYGGYYPAPYEGGE